MAASREKKKNAAWNRAIRAQIRAGKKAEALRAKAVKKQASLRGKGKKKRKPREWEKLFYAIFTFLNLVLTVVTALQKRREIVLAVQDDENVKLLLKERSLILTEKK